MGLLRRSRPVSRRPRRKKCEHFGRVAIVCEKVLTGEVQPTQVGFETMAREYLDLHLEFEALLTHLDGR